MTRLSRFIAIGIAAVAIVTAAPATAKNMRGPAIIVLVENGGTVEDQEHQIKTVTHLLGQLTTLQRRRATRDAQISIVLSASPNKVTWSGTPEQLKEQGQKVLDLITFKPTFSDLVMAWKQIDTTLKLSMPDSYRLYWIGPGIHVPFQEATEELQIKVPQEIDPALLAGVLAQGSEVFKAYNIHPDQDEIYLHYFDAQGVMERARAGQMEFILMDPAQTEANLDKLL